jgi:dsDNA-specific endonuclease/ATPase MutS2
MKKGDTVSAIDEPITGVITSVEGEEVFIETEDGFPMRFQKNEIIVEGSLLKKHAHKGNIEAILSEKEVFRKKKKKTVKPKERNSPPMEVDLHIHKLTDATRLSNYDMLTIQLDTAKRQLEFAIKKKIPRVVFIHGIGEGVLKTELEYLFRRYEAVKYYEADPRKYGSGATEVYIMQNPNS